MKVRSVLENNDVALRHELELLHMKLKALEQKHKGQMFVIVGSSDFDLNQQTNVEHLHKDLGTNGGVKVVYDVVIKKSLPNLIEHVRKILDRMHHLMHLRGLN